MTSRFAWRSAALAAVVTGLVSVGSPGVAAADAPVAASPSATAAPVKEQTMEWYTLSRVAHPEEKGWVSASCPKAAMPYIIGIRFTATPFAKASDARFLEYAKFTQSANSRSAAMEFYNSQPRTTPVREQIGIQVKMGFTCSNVKPSVPPKPLFVKSAVMPAFSSVSLTLSCPEALPTVVETDELHEDGVIPDPAVVAGRRVDQGWLSMIPTDGVVDLIVRCAP